jgi:predicted PurR-regulated permease PerM
MFVTDRMGSGAILAVATVLALGLDNVIRPVLIRRGANLPILLILAGVIGGLLGFGLIGIFVGPTVLAIAHALLTAWINEVEPAVDVEGQETVFLVPANAARKKPTLTPPNRVSENQTAGE